MRIADLLRQAAASFPGSDSPRLDAELLLAHVLGKPREYLYAWPEAEPSSAQIDCFRELCARRASGYPVAYLLGRREFWSLNLRVTPDVLIPRPETELLVSLALELLPAGAASVADLGTGSGAIALALASERPQWRLLACDISAEALAVAAANGRELGLENLEYRLGSWCYALPAGGQLDAIVANPPYIAEGDPHWHRDSLYHEPRRALVADAQGLADIASIIVQAPDHLKPGAWLMLEHGFEQGAEVRRLLQLAGFRDVVTQVDLAGHDRVSLGCRPTTSGDSV